MTASSPGPEELSVPSRASGERGPSVVQRTVIMPFGRYFAARADLLTRDGFKTIVPIEGVSPFSGTGDPDPELQHLADGERTNVRAAIDVRKDLAARLADSGADYLVVDNSTSLLSHREINGRLYTVLPAEDTDLMDLLRAADAAALTFKISREGFTDQVRTRYDAFVRACLDGFDPARIVLVRSHAARFWVAGGGRIAPTDVDRSDARFLEALDDYFVEQTGCQVADGTLGHFPSAVAWQSFDHRLRRVIEDDLVRLCSPPAAGDAAASRTDRGPGRGPRREATAADHVVGAVRQGHPVDPDWLEDYFAAGDACYDDLLALVYLHQRNPAQYGDLVRTCVQYAVTDPRSHPLAVTRARFDRSLRALRGWQWGPLSGLGGEGSLRRSLRGWRWGALREAPGRVGALRGRPGDLVRALHGWGGGVRGISAEELWAPQIAVPCGPVVFRFLADGVLRRVSLARVAASEAEAVVEGRLTVTPRNLLDVLGSWPVYLERGRRRITAAFRVEVADIHELVETCSWLDWEKVLETERVVITNADTASVPARGPEARTDLSFVFEPNTRICTVGGGLMDQITHIALFDQLCTPAGLDYYLDDFRYTWWRSHNGFEASRLAPELDRRRITRLVSQELVESFRGQVMKTRLPWVYNQSRVWYEFGLQEATVVTFDYFNARRLVEIGHEFPLRVYTEKDELGDLIRNPPSPVGFYTTQHRIAIVPESAVPIRRVFSYHHLEAAGLDADVARTAELLRHTPHVAFHVRRGDYMQPHFDAAGWHSQQSHYIEAIDYLITSELGTSMFDVAVFSDDLEFVEAHIPDYGLDRVGGQVRFVRGNSHFKSIYDSYLMALCPVIVGSVGFFAATTSLLADPPSSFVRARPGAVRVQWRR